MGVRHYIVDVWVSDDVISKDVLDTALCETITNLQAGADITNDELSYDLVDMGDEEN